MYAPTGTEYITHERAEARADNAARALGWAFGLDAVGDLPSLKARFLLALKSLDEADENIRQLEAYNARRQGAK